jgi:GNAT superfamily N-acetyltransferase
VSFVISPERPDSPEAVELIEELEAHLASLYPSESRHGYSVDKLIREGVAFFVVRDGAAPAGCGGIQVFGTEFAELKRMYVRPAYRGQGLGLLLLKHLTGYARRHGVGLLRLETGIHQAAAIAMYERAGFRQIPPFAGYRDDPVSRCYEMKLE